MHCVHLSNGNNTKHESPRKCTLRKTLLFSAEYSALLCGKVSTFRRRSPYFSDAKFGFSIFLIINVMGELLDVAKMKSEKWLELESFTCCFRAMGVNRGTDH